MDCGFYKIVPSAATRDYWCECRTAAERIRDAYDREVEVQNALRLKKRLEEQNKPPSRAPKGAPTQEDDLDRARAISP